MTYRYHYLNDDYLKAVRKNTPEGQYIYAIWHQNIFASILSRLKTPHVTMASSSKDGELIAQFLLNIKFFPARGSSTRGGIKGLKEMIRYMAKGTPGALTVDGPKGPKFVPKKGVFELAKLTKAPIIPYIACPEKYWSFEKSWDKFRLPKPFSRIVLINMETIWVTEKLTDDALEHYTNLLTKRLLNGEQDAKKYLKEN